MNDQATIVRPSRLVNMIAAFALPVLLIGLSPLASDAEWLGPAIAGLFIIFRVVVVRRWICNDQRLSASLARKGHFAEALVAAERSEAYWLRHPTLDRFRAPLLASASAYSFLSMAKLNQAYCLFRLGRGPEAREIASSLLQSDPSVVQARELLDVYDSAGVAVPASTSTPVV